MAKTCAICGKGSGMYPLCVSCFKLRDAGKIEKCENCLTWHYTDKPCKCKESAKNVTKENVIKETQEKMQTANVELQNGHCIICQSETEEGHFFCKACYHKYKNKNILIRISECKTAELMDAAYEGTYTCNDGHVVKSKSELAIDNYLFGEKIAHSYEAAIPIDADPEHDLHPDFYLPDRDIYIEHWGFDESNQKYTESKKYKIEKYKELGLTIICTTEKDMNNIQASLSRKLKFCKPGEINE